MKYRAEIDGLRALAILPVILFHAKFSLFSGGFVGVDVFFVISGYLITTIILNDLEIGKFKLLNFYERRARRIIPALITVLIIVYSFSWFLNLPLYHKTIGQYVFSSITFSNNILLYIQGNNYFGIQSSLNPLFHTWSLAVEEQYYLLFPIFLIITWHLGKKKIVKLLIIIFILSLLGANWSSYNIPEASFFLLPTRIWEVLLGAFSAFYLKKKLFKSHYLKDDILSLLGLILIIFSFTLFDDKTPNPSFYTLIPTLGTLLIIIFANKNTFANKFLTNKILVSLGLISYSAYLWHLPIFTIAHQLFIKDFETIQTIFILVLILFISYLTWVFVETPFRKKNKISKKLFFIITGFCCGILLTLSIVGHFNGGFPERSELLSKFKKNNGFNLACNGNTILTSKCISVKPVKIAILGNSYAMHFVSSLAESNKSGVVQLTMDTCSVGYVSTYQDINDSLNCREFFKESVKIINRNKEIQTVYISSLFGEILDKESRESFITLLNDLKNKSIIIVGPTPTAPFNVAECLKNFYVNPFTSYEKKDCNFKIGQRHKDKVQKLFNLSTDNKFVQFVDITKFICKDNECIMEPEIMEFMYTDNGHLTIYGANKVINGLVKNNLIPLN